jgi:hypothetical protein
LPDGIEKDAALALGPWGMLLKEIEKTKKMDMLVQLDGRCLFVEQTNEEQIMLQNDATQCCCPTWKAYHIQCSHLLYLKKKFCKSLFSNRWLQFLGSKNLLEILNRQHHHAIKH